MTTLALWISILVIPLWLSLSSFQIFIEFKLCLKKSKIAFLTFI